MNVCEGYFNVVFFVDDVFVFDMFVFVVQIFVIFYRIEDVGIEQVIVFWFECLVVDGFWFFYFIEGLGEDFFWVGECDVDLVERWVFGSWIEDVYDVVVYVIIFIRGLWDGELFCEIDCFSCFLV